MMTGEFDDLERALRQALDDDAGRIEPGDRLAEILAAARARARGTSSRRRWLVPVAAAASVAVVGGGIYGLSREPDHQVQVPPPAVSTRFTPTPTTGRSGLPTPTTGRSSLPTPTTGQSGTPAVTVRRALPAYYVGPIAGPGSRPGLFRQFVSASVPEGAGPDQLGRAALEAAMRPPAAESADYLQPWAGVQVQSVVVTADRIHVTLSGPGSVRGMTADETRLAVQQLVWTVQAGIGQGSTPVRFSVADGSTSLFGRYATTRTYDRPAVGSSGEQADLAPLWIDDPGPGARVKASSPVVATGQSCTFEGVAQWQLRDGSRLVDSGSTTATSGCPSRGTWQVDLGSLAKGTYTLRVFTTGAADGTTVTAQVSSRFTVR